MHSRNHADSEYV